MKSWQRSIREAEAERDPRPTLPKLDGAQVREVILERGRAAALILRYEWLGNIGNPQKVYGLWLDGDLLGAVTFGWPAGVESRDICGQDHRGLAICLERGACVHYSPRNSASFLIRRATKRMWLEHGYQIFYAYADPMAGEIGTVYQAVGWEYIGQGPGHGNRDRWYFRNPANGRWITSKSFYQRGLKKAEALADGWEFEQRPPKHKYIWFEGSRAEKRRLREACRYSFLPYPKRFEEFRQANLSVNSTGLLYT